jgi:hypothetical protein
MSRETQQPEDERNRRAKRTLRVSVRSTPGTRNPIQPRYIKLTDMVNKVVWRCDDLPRGATLLIHFRDDPRGPFVRLEFAGNRVIGYGNRGLRDTAKMYFYEAAVHVAGTVTTLDYGIVENDSTIVVEPPVGPPWSVENTQNPEDSGEDEDQNSEEDDDQT